MKLLCIALLFLSGCGYSSKDNVAVGQVKKVINKTPILCDNYASVDLSMGVMINGVGSMSTEDAEMLVLNKDDDTLLQTASRNGNLVKITYDHRRVAFCTPPMIVTKVEIIK